MGGGVKELMGPPKLAFRELTLHAVCVTVGVRSGWPDAPEYRILSARGAVVSMAILVTSHHHAPVALVVEAVDVLDRLRRLRVVAQGAEVSP